MGKRILQLNSSSDLKKSDYTIVDRDGTAEAKKVNIESILNLYEIPNGSVGTDNLADDAVTTNKIIGEAVTTNKIIDNAVTSAKILDESVTTVKILDGAVTPPKLSFEVYTKDETDSVFMQREYFDISGNLISSEDIVIGYSPYKNISTTPNKIYITPDASYKYYKVKVQSGITYYFSRSKHIYITDENDFVLEENIPASGYITSYTVSIANAKYAYVDTFIALSDIVYFSTEINAAKTIIKMEDLRLVVENLADTFDLHNKCITKIQLPTSTTPTFRIFIGYNAICPDDLCWWKPTLSIDKYWSKVGGQEKTNGITLTSSTNMTGEDALILKNTNKVSYKVNTISIPLSFTNSSTPIQTALFLGDSTINGGQVVEAARNQYGGNLLVIGTRGTAPNINEGYIGWSTDTFCNKSQFSFNSVLTTNPFFNTTTNSFDFGYYMSNNYPQSVLKSVVIQLGINDNIQHSISPTAPAYLPTTTISNFKTIINSILSYDSTIRIIVNLIMLPNSDVSLTSNSYGLQMTNKELTDNSIVLNNLIVEEFTKSDWNDKKIILNPINYYVDNTTMISDAVHPTAEGYTVIGKITSHCLGL